MGQMLFGSTPTREKLKKRIRKSTVITAKPEEILVRTIDGKSSDGVLRNVWKVLKMVSTCRGVLELLIDVLDLLGVSGVPFGFSGLRFGVKRLFRYLERTFGVSESRNCPSVMAV